VKFNPYRWIPTSISVGLIEALLMCAGMRTWLVVHGLIVFLVVLVLVIEWLERKARAWDERG
jgi:hypothetical protein